MSDRHLCKAKRTDNRKWIEGYYAFIGKKHVIIEKTPEEFFSVDDGEDRSGSRILEVDPETVCRYTGLTDKNGKKIWENDIVKHYNYPHLPDWYDTGVIQWDDIELRFKRTSAMCEEDVCINISCIYEVIGNIFDNPELLEGGAE